MSASTALYTPYIPPPASPDVTPDMRMLRLYSQEDLGGCPLDKWGILDPGTTRRDGGREERQDGGCCHAWLRQ